MSSSVEIVRMVEVTFFRPGSSAATHDYSPPMNECHKSAVVADDQPQTILVAVKRLALSLGEPESYLGNLKAYDRVPGSPTDEYRYKIDPDKVQWPGPYAVATVTPALKVDGRYFKVQELQPA